MIKITKYEKKKPLVKKKEITDIKEGRKTSDPRYSRYAYI